MSRRVKLRAGGRSRSIGMIVMDIANPFYTDLVIGAPRTAYMNAAIPFRLEIARKKPIESAQLLVLMQQRVRGVLLAHIWGLAERVGQLSFAGSPWCAFGSCRNQSDFARYPLMTSRAAVSRPTPTLIRPHQDRRYRRARKSSASCGQTIGCRACQDHDTTGQRRFDQIQYAS